MGAFDCDGVTIHMESHSVRRMSWTGCWGIPTDLPPRTNPISVLLEG